MPLLASEANKLTNESLQRGTVEILIERGAPELLQFLPFKSFTGSAYDFNVEKALPSDKSQRDPYGTSIPGGVGTRERSTNPSIMLSRDADTAKIDVVGKSDFANARTQDHILAAKALARDFMEQFVNGDGQNYNARGLEYWMDWYVNTVSSDYSSQKVFNTTAGTAADYGNAQALSLTAIDDLLSRRKGGRFDLLVSDRASWVKFRGLIGSAGGTMPVHFMEDNFGRPIPMYDGVPWVVLDPVGQQRAYADADYTHTSTTIVVDEASDPYFTGFTDADIGRTIHWDNDSGQDAVIASVTDYKTIVLAAAPTGLVGDETARPFTLLAAPFIYAMRFDEDDGVTSVYHANNGNMSPNVGEHYGPIAGFDAEDMGVLEGSPRVRTRLDWFGQFVVQSPYALARLSHYTT